MPKIFIHLLIFLSIYNIKDVEFGLMMKSNIYSIYRLNHDFD